MNDFDSFSARAARDWLLHAILITCRPSPVKKPTPPNLGYIFRQLFTPVIFLSLKSEVHKTLNKT